MWRILKRGVAQLNYRKSNEIITVDATVSSKTRELTHQLLTAKATHVRERLGQELIAELASGTEISIPHLTVSQARQWHKTYKGRMVFKQYGYYRPKSRYIYITNRTAVRGQFLAPKTFLDTLLHEWLHHYDHEQLGLRSIHTAGFYARLKDIKTKLGYFEDIAHA